MARVAVSVQNIVVTGLTHTYTNIGADGVSFQNDGRQTFISINNTNSTSSTTMTIQTPATVGGLAVAEQTVAVAASTERLMGPYPSDIYNQTDGSVYVDSSLTDSSVQIAVLKL